MAETEIAGIIVPAVVTDDLVSKPVVDLLIEKYKAGKDSLSLADMHEVLNYGLERLLALRRDKEREVSSHIQKDPTVVYKLWKRHVSIIEERVASLNTKYEEEEEQVGKYVLKEMIKWVLNKVIKLLGDECPKEILFDIPSIAEYPTLQKAFQDIQTQLQSDGVKCVALDGPKGMAKRIIMKHLNDHFCGSVDFDVVIFIKLTANDEQTDLHILQKNAERIRVDTESNEFEVTGRIQKVLENKRYLLILDGLRNQTDAILRKLEISKDKKHSKVVIYHKTTIWSMIRCVDCAIPIPKLSRAEVWKLFRHNVRHNHLPPTAKLASPLEGESSSKSYTNAIGKPHLVQDVLRLIRTRDFALLMLSYPMRIGYEEKFLKSWISEVYMWLSSEDFDYLWGSFQRLLDNESPLRYLQAVIPQDITTEIIKGGSVSRETALKYVPKPILLLATHLALQQLTFTLTSDTMHCPNIWFSTRNDAEKRTVVEDVKANSQIRAAFDDLEINDLNQIDDETKRELVLLNLETRLEQNTTSRHLVLVVDGDGDKKADPLRVSLPMNDSRNVVVFITTLSSNDYLTSQVDLTIKTEYHLLPWELFCNIVGSELLHSSIAIQEIAVRIVKKCRGHLLAIRLMAKSLKNVTDVQLWELALQKLLYRDREAIVNALVFNIIWANELSEREKARLIRCSMVFNFQDDWKMSDDQLFARWFSRQLVDTKEEATSILKTFMECYVLLQFEDTEGRHILLPEDIKLLFHSIREEIPENLSEGALVSTIPNLQVLNLSYTQMQYLYEKTTRRYPSEFIDLSGWPMETLPKGICKLQTLEILKLEGCSQLRELPPQIAELENLKELRLKGCERLETLPQEISELHKLETLSLEQCSQLRELPPQIAELENLKELRLEGCERLETLPQEISELHKLETLSLEQCSQLRELPPQIAVLENLKELRLKGFERLDTLPQEISELHKLESLSLEQCSQLRELPPHIAVLENLKELRLTGCERLETLPRFVNLPNLMSLSLGNNLNLMKIPSSFFEDMPQLIFLDLSRTSLHELPSSIFKLQKLKELCLKECELFVELPPELGQLTNLTTLDLDVTLITHLPKEIGKLTNLESLSLSFYNDSNHGSKITVIPLGVLLEFTHLRVLKIDINSDNEWWFKNIEILLEQIYKLEKLQTLAMYIPKVEFSARIPYGLPKFRFIMGHHKPRMISRVPLAIEVMFKKSSRSLKFVNGEDFPDKVRSILYKALAFFLDRHMKISNLTQFGLNYLKQLLLCILAECNEMQSIVDADEYEAASHPKESFRMQFLTIFYMKNLKSIVSKPIHCHPIFCELKLLALHTCPELTAIFTMDSQNSLVNLEELIVEDCPKVSSIISCPSSEQTTGFFLPKLRKLSLLFVPELTSISNGVFIGGNLEQMGLYDCPKLQRLSITELSSKKLKVIRAEREWWEKLQWSKAEWGQEDPPHKFSQIFSPFDEDLDILTQLTPYEVMNEVINAKDI